MPTTLLELANEELAAAELASTSAQQDLLDAQDARSAAKAEHQQVTDELAAIAQEIEQIRETLLNIETPADADPLLAQLEEKTIEHRGKQADLIERDSLLAESEENAAGAAAELDRATSRLREAEEQVGSAETENSRRDALKTAAGQPPLATLQADADDALNSPPANDDYLTAKARVEADFPVALITRARERRSRALAREAKANTSLAAAQDESSDQALFAFQRAEEEFQKYVSQAKAQYDLALAQLSRVMDPLANPLTAEQQAQITNTDIVSDGTAAAATEKALDDAQADLDDKQAALDDAVLKALAADIDADPSADTDVQNATTDRDAAIVVRDSAAAAHTSDLQADLNIWEAAVPDDTWQLLADFEGADATLESLRDTDPATLASDLDTAETTLVNALLAEDRADRTRKYLEAEVAGRALRAEIESNSARSRRFSALRGDF